MYSLFNVSYFPSLVGAHHVSGIGKDHPSITATQGAVDVY